MSLSIGDNWHFELRTRFLKLSPMTTIRLILADDHVDVLNSLATRLKREPGIRIVGRATNSAQAIAITVSKEPDVVIIDPMMRDGNGFTALRQIVQKRPEALIIILTAFADTAMKVELNKLGITRIISKGTETAEIIGTLTSFNLSSDLTG
jgi:DNA-binding NarL/FixJ family response regulator